MCGWRMWYVRVNLILKDVGIFTDNKSRLTAIRNDFEDSRTSRAD